MNIIEHLNEKKNFFMKKENIYIFFIILVIFGIDRFSKNKIISSFNDNVYYLNKFINLDLIWNTGIGFGLLSSNSTIFYNSVTILIGLIIVILSYIAFTSEILDKFIFSIIIGGAFGNFCDRLLYHAVPDFIDLHYESFHWFTFNVADIFITLGIIFFIIRGFFLNNKIK
jgi:signal peptidase II